MEEYAIKLTGNHFMESSKQSLGIFLEEFLEKYRQYFCIFFKEKPPSCVHVHTCSRISAETLAEILEELFGILKSSLEKFRNGFLKEF